MPSLASDFSLGQSWSQFFYSLAELSYLLGLEAPLHAPVLSIKGLLRTKPKPLGLCGEHLYLLGQLSSPRIMFWDISNTDVGDQILGHFVAFLVFRTKGIFTQKTLSGFICLSLLLNKATFLKRWSHIF